MRESFLFYKSFVDALSNLNDEDRLKCYDAICSYAVTGEEDVNLSGVPASIFLLVKPQIDANNRRYENGLKGRSGGETKAEAKPNQTGSETEAKTNQSRTKAEAKPNQTGSETEANVNDNENVNVNDKSKSTDARESAADRFEDFWVKYPKKVGKGDARKSWNRIKPGKDLFEKMLQALAEQVESAQWQEENGRFIPNPSTWLNQGRWDDELPSIRGRPTRVPTGTKFNNFEQREDDIDSIALAMMKKRMKR